MRDVRIPVHSILGDMGSCICGEDVLEESEYRVGPETYGLPDGINIEYTLSNVGEAILLTGHARARVKTECSRCLAPMEMNLDGDLEGYYLIDAEHSPEDRDADEYSRMLSDESIDISDAVLAALVIETPVSPLCREDCAGLCPRCGADLNEGPCGCRDDEIDPMNPFVVLKDFVFDDPEGGGDGDGKGSVSADR